MRPQGPLGWDTFLPGAVGLFLVVLQYLQYRISYRGFWVVEVADRRAESTLAIRWCPSRTAAVELLEAFRERVRTADRDDVARLLSEEL